MINLKHETDIERKMEHIYFNQKRQTIRKGEAMRQLIGLCECLNDYEISLEEIIRLTMKSIYYISKIGNIKNSGIYEFLEAQLIDSDMNVERKRKIYTILKTYFPRKLHSINQFLLEHVPDFIEHELYDIRLNDVGLTDFLFNAFKLLKDYTPEIRFNNDMGGFCNDTILIVNKKFDTNDDEIYTKIGSFYDRDKWEWKPEERVYIVNNREIGVKELYFAVNLFKNQHYVYKDNKLSIYIPSTDDNPIRIEHELGDIRFYIFRVRDYFGK